MARSKIQGNSKSAFPRDPLDIDNVTSSDAEVNPLKSHRRKSKKYRRKHSNTKMAAAIGGVSPSRSPRLPSPPPFPEVQIGPKSPGFNPEQSTAIAENTDTTKLDIGAMRRIRPGTKAADMASGPPLVPLAELDSPFQLQEHLKALYHHHTKSSSDPTTTIPITHTTALILATPPEGVDRSLWLYELCRFLVQKANNLIVAFFQEDPMCSSKTCPEMRASEWQYLCAVHDPPKACCAIDYCCHTLDWAANVLTSQKQFPSRLTLGTEASGGTQQSVRQLTNIFRRVYRIFAHAWFQHRAVFWQVEASEGLYVFFKKVCDVYGLIQEDNYTISPEAEGLLSSEKDETTTAESGMAILKKQPEDAEPKQPSSNDDSTTTLSTATTARRHKHTPSTGSLVPTIAEGDEDDTNLSQPPKKSEDPSLETPTSQPPTEPQQSDHPPANATVDAPSRNEEESSGLNAANDEANLPKPVAEGGQAEEPSTTTLAKTEPDVEPLVPTLDNSPNMIQETNKSEGE